VVNAGEIILVKHRQKRSAKGDSYMDTKLKREKYAFRRSEFDTFAPHDKMSTYFMTL